MPKTGKIAFYREPDKDYDGLSNEELCKRIRDGEDKHGLMIMRLIKQNEGFVQVLLRPFIKAKLIEAEEVPSISFIAISSAIDYWDYSKGSFLTVLPWFLRREITEAVNNARTCPLPRNMVFTMNKYRKYLLNYRETHGGNDPTDADVMRDLRLSASTLDAFKNAILIETAARLDAPILADDGSEVYLADSVPDESIDIADTGAIGVYREQLKAALDDALSALPTNEREAIVAKYFTGSAQIDGADAKALRRGLTELRRPPYAKRLRPYLEDFNCFRSTGLSSFRITLSGQPERLAIDRIGGKRHDY